MINQGNLEVVYNIKRAKDERIKLFTGEGGRFMQMHGGQVIYQGGYMGTQYNFRIGFFNTIHAMMSNECKIQYEKNQES